MGTTDLYYPTSDEYDIEQGYVLGFSAAPYSVLASERTRDHILADGAYLNIALPLPTELVVQTQDGYSEEANPVGPMLSAAGALNSGGEAAMLKRVFVDPMVTYFNNISSTVSQQMYSNITEMSLKSEARREFTFSWLLVPKNKQDADAITNICNYFREASYPVYADLPERVYPAPIWAIYILAADSNGADDTLTRNWLGDPLVCVLAAVAVNKLPLDSTRPTYFKNNDGTVDPVATALSVVFKEFETGAAIPGGRVVSKSEFLSGG
jgi:hypothetical protein